MTITEVLRLTQYAHGGGCACKIPPGELEDVVAGLAPTDGAAELLAGLRHGDDAAVVRTGPRSAIVSTADFSNPVVDSPYDWGRIAAANALSDVYAMGGTPLVAVNLLAWPRAVLPMSLAAEVLRGGRDAAAAAGCHIGGGHSVDDAEPKYGMAVTGYADPDHLLRIDTGRAGLPLTLTKPLGTGVLNTHHKATGEPFAHAVEVMAQLNAEASRAALDEGATCDTDVTGFGLLGHLHKLARASGVTALIDAGSIGYLAHARESLAAGYVSGGTRRNLDWVRPHGDFTGIAESELLLLADAQISGGLLVAGEVPGYPVIGELLPPRPDGRTLVVR
ncbi:MAG: selenide, water dikinase [Cryptosporangiaceae bacterium]|nr:selenide, water dikinase [Cryptosporangiaceae bacterium]